MLSRGLSLLSLSLSPVLLPIVRRQRFTVKAPVNNIVGVVYESRRISKRRDENGGILADHPFGRWKTRGDRRRPIAVDIRAGREGETLANYFNGGGWTEERERESFVE